MSFLPRILPLRFLAKARCWGSGAELFAFCHAEFISASLSVPPLPAGKAGISESIYITPESSSGPETLKRVQGDNIVFPQQILISWKGRPE
jgi:hypothetical protein